MFQVRTLVNVKVFGTGYIDSNVSAKTASHSLTLRCGAEEVQINVFSATAVDGSGQFRATAASDQEGRAPRRHTHGIRGFTCLKLVEASKVCTYGEDQTRDLPAASLET
jgi:hypothetical protein